MRRARLLVLALAVGGVVALLVVAALQRTSTAFTLGVVPGAPVVPLHAHEAACQRPIDVPSGASFDRISLQLGTYQQPGPAVVISVRDLRGRRLASGRLSAGYADVAVQPRHHIRLDREVRAPARIAVCVRDTGPRRVAIYGGADAAARTST